MQAYQENISAKVSGVLSPILGVSVTVTDTASGLPATLYSDNGVTQIAQPLVTDETGYFGFYAANGSYTVKFSSPQIAVGTRKIELYDRDDDAPLTQAQAASPTGASGIGYGQRTVANKLDDVVSVKDKGADHTGVNDSTTAFLTAFSLADEVVIPAGTYKLTKGLSLAGPAGAYKIRTIGRVTLMMSGLGAAEDAVTFVGYNYKGGVIEGDLIVDMQWTGRDGLKVLAGDAPRASRVTLRNVPRDCIQFFTVDGNWVENGKFERISGENIGRHMIAAYTGGTQGAFINEMVFEQCELRGCAQKYTGGTFVYASAGGVEGMGAKMSEWTFIDCNADAQRAKATAAGFDIGASPVFLAYNNTGSGKGSIYESWRFYGGGWESTSGPALQTQGLFYSAPGSGAQQNVCRGWHTTGITPGGWGNASFTGVFDDYFDHNKQFGTVKAPFINEGWNQVTVPASTTANIDINLPLVHIPVTGRVKGMDVFELSLFYQQYTGAGFGVYRSRLYVTYQVSGTDQYTLHEDNERSSLGGFFTVNGLSLLNAAGGTTINIANVPKTLRASITTSATWASGGGDNLMYALLKHVGRTHGEFPGQYF